MSRQYPCRGNGGVGGGKRNKKIPDKRVDVEMQVEAVFGGVGVDGLDHLSIIGSATRAPFVQAQTPRTRQADLLFSIKRHLFSIISNNSFYPPAPQRSSTSPGFDRS